MPFIWEAKFNTNTPVNSLPLFQLPVNSLNTLLENKVTEEVTPYIFIQEVLI